MASTYALVTGASDGLGLEFAKIYAQQNYDVILIARNHQKLQQLSSELSSKYNITCHIYVCDLSKKEEYISCVENLIAQKHIPQILINNAGIGGFGTAIERDISKDFAMMELNMHAPIYFCQKLIPHMQQMNTQAYVLNVASAAAFVHGPYQAIYYASKAFIHSYSCALQQELKHGNVHVMSYCPGRMATSFHHNAGGQLHESTHPIEYFAVQAHEALMQRKSMLIMPRKMQLMLFMMRFAPRFAINLYVNKKSRSLCKKMEK